MNQSKPATVEAVFAALKNTLIAKQNVMVALMYKEKNSKSTPESANVSIL